ncbi:MAG: hypothetical protein WCS47_09195, partial [Thermovirgaceae bacterium]
KDLAVVRLLDSHHGEHPLAIPILRVFSHLRLDINYLGNSPYTFDFFILFIKGKSSLPSGTLA